ncbi:MAG: hypothetical protein IKY83_07260 [Proteobacteria bacterium]|nr:hypothetical protein [Pseudomonadota bacterium]
MKKALVLSIVTALTLTAMSCSDDKKTPELCVPKDYPVCDGDTLLTCSADQRVEKEICPAGCTGDKGEASCKKSSPSGDPGSGSSRPSQPEPEASDCGNITEKGVCEGNTLKRCNNNKLQTVTCRSGMTCKPGEDGVNACQPEGGTEPEPSEWNYKNGDPCGNITLDGICAPDGSKLAYCQDGVLHVEFCSSKCTVVEGTADCYEPCPDDLDIVGRCTEDGYEYCHEDNLHIIRSCDTGYSCQLHPNGYYTCLESK